VDDFFTASDAKVASSHHPHPSLDKEGLGVVDFRANRLFSYTFWLCSLNSDTQTPFGSRAASSHDPFSFEEGAGNWADRC
jgi:hypothetical protein